MSTLDSRFFLNNRMANATDTIRTAEIPLTATPNLEFIPRAPVTINRTSVNLNNDYLVDGINQWTTTVSNEPYITIGPTTIASSGMISTGSININNSATPTDLRNELPNTNPSLTEDMRRFWASLPSASVGTINRTDEIFKVKPPEKMLTEKTLIEFIKNNLLIDVTASLQGPGLEVKVSLKLADTGEDLIVGSDFTNIN